MDINEFWRLIEEAHRRARPGPTDSYMDRYVDKLTQRLRERGPKEVVAFRDHFQDRLRDAYSWDLWGAAEVIGQGFCSDDWFEYFRCWLVSMGREVYEQALANPDSLIEPVSRPEVADPFFEALLYVPHQVYEVLTGAEIPDYPGFLQLPESPSGTAFRDDGSDLPERYPRLWARFGGQHSPAPRASHRAYVPRRWSQVDRQRPSHGPSRAEPDREHMDMDEFWRVIEEARRDARPDSRDGYIERFVAKLERCLRERSPEEVFEFSNRFEDRIREALARDLWDAAGLILQRAFDDGREWPLHWFDYFGGWLVSMGRDVYERALADPDSLVEPATRPGLEDWHLDELLCVPDRVYEDMMGTELPAYPASDALDEPPSAEQDDHKPDLSQRLPRLWAQFGRGR